MYSAVRIGFLRRARVTLGKRLSITSGSCVGGLEAAVTIRRDRYIAMIEASERDDLRP